MGGACSASQLAGRSVAAVRALKALPAGPVRFAPGLHARPHSGSTARLRALPGLDPAVQCMTRCQPWAPHLSTSSLSTASMCMLPRRPRQAYVPHKPRLAPAAGGCPYRVVTHSRVTSMSHATLSALRTSDRLGRPQLGWVIQADSWLLMRLARTRSTAYTSWLACQSCGPAKGVPHMQSVCMPVGRSCVGSVAVIIVWPSSYC